MSGGEVDGVVNGYAVMHNFILKSGDLGQQQLKQKKERYTGSNSLTYMLINVRSNLV